ncbi:hypothetical protein SAMN05216388_1002325 [Halorientalis persicus]|jgi:hypothetical protein|uniref:Uncharacterized protein n=1 Tax=Halorientalis persicus TaxID=1367881 RepID=A0A1H8FM92_9EURY|nr:hypothetical protein [Halorientalis persicus]SEN32799.1 hypothetical protein SAMN05216388_1002325 [Halorientalis persicus]
MDVQTEIERQLIAASVFEESPESWYVRPGANAPRLRGRWVETTDVRDQQPRYVDVDATGDLADRLAGLLDALSNRYSIEMDAYPLGEHSTVSLADRARRISSNTGDGGPVGVVRFEIENAFDHEAADEEVYLALSRHLEDRQFDGLTLTDENIGDIRARFRDGTLSRLHATVDGTGHALTPEELGAERHEFLEAALADYEAIIDVDGEHWIENESFAVVDDPAAPERAAFSVHVPL